MDINEFKTIIKKEKMVFGTERTTKLLKLGKVKHVFLAKNCPERVQKEIMYYAKLAKIDASVVNKTNEELGVLCKKQFSISVLCQGT